MEIQIKPYVFRAYDIRGEVPSELNGEVMYRIGLALAETYKSTTLGYDIRTTSPSLASAFISGFLEAGGDLAFQGLSSFGVALFAGWKEGKHGKATTSFITASHLPSQYNGIKFYYSNGVGMYEEEIKKIRDRVLSGAPNRVSWKDYKAVSDVDYKGEYISYLGERYDLGKMRIAVDCGGGATSLVAGNVFEACNAVPTLIFGKPNPSFSDRPSEPKPEVLKKLRDTLAEEKFAFGVAFDGDGDRAVILDERGRAATPEQIGVIIAKSILEDKGKGIVLANIECSKVIEEQLGELADVRRIPVGHTYLTHYAEELNAILGVEASGHYLVPGVLPFDDGMVIPLEIGRIIERSGRKLSEILDEIPVYPKAKLEFKVPDDVKFDVFARFKELATARYDHVNTIDGVRVELENGWVLVRPSNTSPIIRITAEANTEEDATRLARQFEGMLERCM